MKRSNQKSDKASFYERTIQPLVEIFIISSLVLLLMFAYVTHDVRHGWQ